jgi:5-methylcytosine-specific restriction enzyme subunit McrC
MTKELIEIQELDSSWTPIKFPNKLERDSFYLSVIKYSTIWMNTIRLKEQPFIVKKRGDTTLLLRSKGVTGVVSISGKELQISPKFLDKDNPNWKTVLINILEHVKNKNRYLISNSELNNSDLSLYNYLADIFIAESRKIQSEGLPRRYKSKENNLTYLKGKYDTRKIAYQLTHLNKLPVKYTEYIEDTPVSRTIKVASEMLSELVSGNNRKQKLLAIASIIQAPSIIPQRYELQSLYLSPAYSELQKLLDLAKMVVDRQSLSLNNGNYTGKGLLWATAPIFESFLKSVAKSVCRERGLVFSDAGIKYVGSTYGYTLSSKEKKVFPDIQIYDEQGDLKYLFDAKYKVWEGAPKREDIYQMVTYASNSNLGKITLLYPSHEFVGEKNMILENLKSPLVLSCNFINIMKMRDRNGFLQIKKDFEALLQ